MFLLVLFARKVCFFVLSAALAGYCYCIVVQVRFDGLANRQAEDQRGVDLPEDQEEGGVQTGDNRLNLGGIYIIFSHIKQDNNF